MWKLIHNPLHCIFFNTTPLLLLHYCIRTNKRTSLYTELCRFFAEQFVAIYNSSVRLLLYNSQHVCVWYSPVLFSTPVGEEYRHQHCTGLICHIGCWCSMVLQGAQGHSVKVDVSVSILWKIRHCCCIAENVLLKNIYNPHIYAVQRKWETTMQCRRRVVYSIRGDNLAEELNPHICCKVHHSPSMRRTIWPSHSD